MENGEYACGIRGGFALAAPLAQLAAKLCKIVSSTLCKATEPIVRASKACSDRFSWSAFTRTAKQARSNSGLADMLIFE